MDLDINQKEMLYQHPAKLPSCITFGFEHSAVVKTSQDSHNCGDHTQCPNWVVPMGVQEMIELLYRG